ncbi:MAG TPA: sensor histidine kinase, partial [Steroidobacteraceae bacterium]|nr:sensor histidine kinase [Steroidobacteraceae bacterium]
EFRETVGIDPDDVRLEPGDPSIEVRFDASHLHQILWNLCEIALKYGCPEGSDDPIEVRTGRIAGTGRPYVEIADRGPGIDATQRERIFEPFFTSGQGSTGLGLFISRELAQCNRALLVYEPRSGGGSTFRVIFADPQRWEL